VGGCGRDCERETDLAGGGWTQGGEGGRGRTRPHEAGRGQVEDAAGRGRFPISQGRSLRGGQTRVDLASKRSGQQARPISGGTSRGGAIRAGLSGSSDEAAGLRRSKQGRPDERQPPGGQTARTRDRDGERREPIAARKKKTDGGHEDGGCGGRRNPTRSDTML
jgi:hypothetical protein